MTDLQARLRQPLVVDGAMLFVLCTVALYGFHETYTGQTYLLAGVVGLLLGMALAVLAVRLAQPVIVLAVFTVVAFFLLGGAVALHSLGGTAVLPVPHTLGTLADNSVHGWKKLLTTLPPVDGGPLLTLPYLLGLVAGAGGMTLAARVRLPVAPVLAPVLLLAGVILLGVQHPHEVVLLAAVFAALVVTWVVLRARRTRGLQPGGRRLSRRLTAAGLCVGAAAVSVAAGPHLPGLAADRTVLRSHVVPPFDVGQYPSPLAGFRKYTKGYQTKDPSRKLYDVPLLRVTGLPAGTRIRFAALDSYNGEVWAAANDSGLTSGPEDTFQKVGSTIDNPAPTGGTRVSATVTVEPAYDGASDVWVPTAGDLTGIHFQRPDQQSGSDAFRYNLTTSTGVLPSGLTGGDRYAFTAVVPDEPVGEGDSAWSQGGTYAALASRFQPIAAEWAGDGPTPMAQVLSVAEHMKADGSYTDGEAPNEQYPAGHSLRRLSDFVAKGAQMAGDDEQYAAMMAVLANQLGVPARVVVGAVPESDGFVRGRDVHAWVELRAGDGSWRTLDWHQFMNTDRKPQQTAPQPEQLVTGKVIPPPAPVRPPATTGDPLDESVNQKAKAHHDDHHAPGLPGYLTWIVVYVGLPLLAALLVCALIVAVKAWRRRRRRTRGMPTRRLALGWREVLDHARDFGHPAPPRATRREQADALTRTAGLPVGPLAYAADAHMFGAAVPTDEIVAAFWADVDDVRRTISRSRPRLARLRAALNLTTFRHPR